ncbi:MAG: hypothetical protein ACKPAH_03905 [Verrucomicrobiota bacterium]
MKPSTFLPHWGLAATCLAALPQLASQASDYAKAVLADGPAAYYRLGER